jgi:hypothetical protein
MRRTGAADILSVRVSDLSNPCQVKRMLSAYKIGRKCMSLPTLRSLLTDFFEGVPDFRKNPRKKHYLMDILVITPCRPIIEADDFKKIELFGKAIGTFLRTFPALPDERFLLMTRSTGSYKLMDKKAFGEYL